MKPVQAISRRAALAALAATTTALALNSRKDAPKFKAKSLDGDLFTNESVKGQAVLIEFWATWCKYCKRDEPAVEALGKEFAGKLLVMAVNVGESKKTVQQYLQQNPRSAKVVLTSDTNLAAMMEATSYPKYVLIDEEGKLAGEQRGSGGEASLRKLLKEVYLVGSGATNDSDDVRLESSPAPR